jgi:uncharacterized protein (TIGR02118 family)
MAYYLQKHIPLVRERLTPLRLLRLDLEEGLAGGEPGTASPYYLIGNLNFDSLEDLQRAMAMHGEELIADIPIYKNQQVQMLISRII